VEDTDQVNKLNIDDLYQKQQQRDLKQVSIFNKILNRIHHRITLTARSKKDKHIWFVVPEYIFGESVYKKEDCIAYIVAKLEINKFHIRYIHPNTLFISWADWVPSYVRTEFRKKTGIAVDEFGNIVDKEARDEILDADDPNAKLLNIGGVTETKKSIAAKDYTPITNYKPTGKLVYNPELFEHIERRVSFK
jgi:hypothetical protein